MAKGDEAKLNTFQHKCLHRLLEICTPIYIHVPKNFFSQESQHRDYRWNPQWNWCSSVSLMTSSVYNEEKKHKLLLGRWFLGVGRVWWQGIVEGTHMQLLQLSVVRILIGLILNYNRQKEFLYPVHMRIKKGTKERRHFTIITEIIISWRKAVVGVRNGEWSANRRCN